ncbi:MAG: hypothetical protein V3U02_03090 [Calditrichia bacterium]
MNKLKDWLSLVLGIVILGLLAFIGIPSFNSLDYVNRITTSSKDSDIDAASLFYSETEQSSEAEIYFTFPGDTE